MKSRKLGFLDFGKRKMRPSAKSAKRSTVRLGVLEGLEKREMMAADFADILAPRGLFSNAAAQTRVLNYFDAKTGGNTGGGGNGAGASEYDGSSLTVTEAEPNNGFTQAQLIPFTNNTAVIVNGNSINSLDDEHFAMDLNAGDIIDIRLQSSFSALISQPFITLFNSARRELISSQWQPFGPGNLPQSSPLTGGGTAAGLGDVALHYVIPTTGRYVVRISDVAQAAGTPNNPAQPVNWTMSFRRFRPVLEAAPAGTKQVLFLDFEGGFINRNLFSMGLPGSARLSPTRDFLNAYGLEDTQESLFIDSVVRHVKAKFDKLQLDTTNKNFGIEIRNSKDHADPWGLPNVSRVVVGGTFQELVSDPAAPSGLLGISQSIDPGNFETEETAIVMHDTFLLTVNSVPLNAAKSRLELISELMSVVIVHEAGHFLGGWHQEPFNTKLGIMDAFYDQIVSSGSGPDGIFGTSDDRPLYFSDDRFGGAQPFVDGGVNDTINWLGWGLSAGKVGGMVQGTVFHDLNLNRGLDTSDIALSQVLVYSDANGNGTFDANEFSTTSLTDGKYSLLLTPGQHTIRSVIPTGFRASTPLSNAYVLNVPATGSVSARDFGYELILQSATGRKWNDLNGNAIRDVGEPNVSGVKIYYDLDGDGRLDIGEPQATTSADGTYTLPRLAAGTYTIREVVEAGWVQTSPGAAGNFGHTVILTGNPVTDAQTLTGLDFGNQLLADYGDAPSIYGSASAGFVNGLRLGANWDAEGAPAFSANSDGDDIAGTDDEDGVRLGQPLVRGASNNLFVIDKVNSTGQAAFVNVWIDFDRDGVFEETEKIATPETGFLVPSTTALGTVNARFRYGFAQNVGPTGFTTSGEVEDYQFIISNSSNIAVDDFDTVARNQTKQVNVLLNDFKLSETDTLTVIATSGTTSAGGSAVRKSDGSAVIYTAPIGFVGRDTFQYTVQNSLGQTSIATVTIDVSLFFENPVAVDDSFDLPTNSIDFPLNVLANDIEGQGGALSIISVVQPDKGGSVSIASGGKSLRYTPPRNFGGTEFITYTAIDTSGTRTSAKVSLHTLPNARQDDLVQIRLQAVSADTPSSVLNPPTLSQINQGQEFKLRVYVDDLRHDSATNPGSGSGVFAAYFDLLYNLQLVSTIPVNDSSSRFNFEVNFVNDYTEFTRGDASVPGLVNEFGATFDSLNMQVPDELLMAEIMFTARSPGVVRFASDPSDVSPDSDTLLFNVSESAVPIERIRYLSTELEVFGSDETFPLAVDDTTRKFAVNSTNNRIEVLRNDNAGSTGSIRVVRVQGERGTVVHDGTTLRYTPPTNFSGVDQFTYTIEDTRGIQSTATVTVHVGNIAGDLNPDSNDIVDLELQVTNEAGQPIDQITVGETFVLRGFVKDLRTVSPDPDRDVRGVFSVYQDLLFNQRLVAPVLSTTNDPNLGFRVSFSPQYSEIREGDVRVNSLINEIGATSPSTSAANYLDRRLNVFNVTMRANSAGIAEFFSDPSDVNDVLIFEPAGVVPIDQIHFGFASLNVVGSSSGSGERHNSSNPLDVNNDGKVSPLDALIVISELNNRNAPVGGGEGEAGMKFTDTNNDGRITALDALKIISALNNRRASGEGESGFLAAPAVESSGTELVGEGEVDSSYTSLQPTKAKSFYGPIAPAQFSTLADSVFSSDDMDELDSVLDDLVSDIDLSWNKNLLS